MRKISRRPEAPSTSTTRERTGPSTDWITCSPGPQRQVGEDPVERLDAAADEPAQRLVHEQDRAGLAHRHHRQAERVGAAPGGLPFAQIGKAPQIPVGVHRMDHQPQMPPPRDHVFLCDAVGPGQRLQPEQQRPRRGHKLAQHRGQAVRRPAAGAVMSGAIGRHDPVLAVAEVARRLVQRHETHQRLAQPAPPPFADKAGRGLQRRRGEQDRAGQHQNHADKGIGHHDATGEHGGGNQENRKRQWPVALPGKAKRSGLNVCLGHGPPFCCAAPFSPQIH
jgi:hypothetical protein